MTIRDIVDPLAKLLDDGAQSEFFLESDTNNQFARRNYIRNTFSCMEGSIWLLKEVCLKATDSNGRKAKISVGEFLILSETNYELKSNGEIKKNQKKLKFTDNIKFTFLMINKLFKMEIDLNVGSKSWEELLEAINIRNRIIHPKGVESLTISDEEIKICQNAVSWYNSKIHQFIQKLLDKSSHQNL